ncbi:MAG: lysophospholipid acyltransferase family protein [Planctomycetota bacterium]
MPEASRESGAAFLPPDYSERFARFFRWWCRHNMVRKKFFALRVAGETEGDLRAFAGHDGPVIAATNHVSWWDPLVMLTLHDLELCTRERKRTLRAPMDIVQLERFKFFRKLGTFGIDPDDPESLGAMSEHLDGYFRTDHAPTLWINPQGRFADVRDELEIRPGVARVAALDERAAVVAVAIEYAFWLDAKSEVFVRFETARPEARTTTGWLRAIREAMVSNQRRLAEAVRSRDAGRFVNRVGGEGANVHPLYGLWLRLRGKAGQIDDRSRPGGEPATSEGEHAGA